MSMILQLQEGDFDNGIVQRVQNRDSAAGLLDTLFNDRVFWLDSQQIESVDYDVRAANLLNARNNQQFKCIAALFNIRALEIGKEMGKELLGQHF
mmetsp:Transcript_37964/g.49868  ORF Transcript_37964/g.49868 Transcript_37964/m.49868 type:complete len:95 (-) Transcript_37964:580-864(-)